MSPQPVWGEGCECRRVGVEQRWKGVGGRGRRKGLRGRGETGSHRRLHSEQQQLGAVRLEVPFFLQS